MRGARCVLFVLVALGCRSTAVTPASAPPAPPLFYEVFVRSFLDTNGDGQGDLLGVRQQLPYLQRLGVRGLWLMPIHPSPSYHGYDVVNFDDVNPDYGTLRDMDALLEDAHALGMKVILDLVLNHTSNQHPWFVQHPDWYLWRDSDPGWRAPWPGGGAVWHPGRDGRFYFGMFWEGMPDLNLANPDVHAAMVASSRRWLARGVDGFRVDAARHLMEDAQGTLADLPETHAYARRFRRDLGHPNAMLVAEAWTTRDKMEPYRGNADEFTHAFDFDLATAVVASLLSGKATHVQEQVRAVKHWEYEATFLSNHDLERLRTRLYSDDAVKAAHVSLAMLPGTPFLFMGDELLTRNGDGAGDLRKRTPMKWTPQGGFSSGKAWLDLAEGDNVEEAWANGNSLLNLIAALSRLRSTAPAFSAASTLQVMEGLDAQVLGLVRGDVRAWINCGETPVDVSVGQRRHMLGAPVLEGTAQLGPHGFVVTGAP